MLAALASYAAPSLRIPAPLAPLSTSLQQQESPRPRERDPSRSEEQVQGESSRDRRTSAWLIESWNVKRLSDLYKHGHPSNDVAKAGLMVHAFDDTEDWLEPWKPCSKDKWCKQFDKFWSASIINAHQRHTWTTSGILLAPGRNQVLCSGEVDIATYKSGCYEPNTNDQIYPPDKLQDMLDHSMNKCGERCDQYNEVVINSTKFVESLPASILAFVYFDDAELAEQERAVKTYVKFLDKLQLTECRLPLLKILRNQCIAPKCISDSVVIDVSSSARAALDARSFDQFRNKHPLLRLPTSPPEGNLTIKESLEPSIVPFDRKGCHLDDIAPSKPPSAPPSAPPLFPIGDPSFVLPTAAPTAAPATARPAAAPAVVPVPIAEPSWADATNLPSPPPPWPAAPPTPPPSPSPLLPPPTPSPPSPPLAPSPAPPRASIKQLNELFSQGQPSNDPAEVGLTIHTFDETEDYNELWKPCTTGWCVKYQTFWSTSVVNAKQRNTFTSSGIVLTPAHTKVLCSWPKDIAETGSLGTVEDPCSTRFDEGRGPYASDELEEMLSLSMNAGDHWEQHNEVVVDSQVYLDNLPSSIAAVVYFEDASDEERVKATETYLSLLDTYGLTVDDIFLLRLNRAAEHGPYVEDASAEAADFLSDKAYQKFRGNHPNLQLPSDRQELERQELERRGSIAPVGQR